MKETTMWGATWWDAFQAIGTVAAVVVALSIALADYFRNTLNLKRQTKEAWTRTASLVSAWVETRYEPSSNGQRYEKQTILSVSNQSDEPVYEVNVDVAIGPPFRQIGPLSVPVPIATLPPRSIRTWDISAGLLAHEAPEGLISFSEPVARISFFDPRSRRWHRDYNGELYEDSGQTTSVTTDPSPENELQFGNKNALNPLFIASAFVEALRKEGGPDLAMITALVDARAKNWSSMSSEDFSKLGKKLENYSIPVHAWYRTERVSYIRLIPDSALETDVPADDGAYFEVSLLTLVFRPNEGWKVFSFGATAAEWIDFGLGETKKSIRSFLDES